LKKKVKGSKLVKDEETGNVENGHPLKAIDNHDGSDPTSAGGENTEVVTYTANPEVKQFEQNRNEYINILKELRQKNPDIGIDELQQMAELEILKRGPKSRAFYRVQATRKLIGNPTNLKKKLAEKNLEIEKKQETLSVVEEVDPNLTTIMFEPAHYTCFESVGSLEVYVTRSGGDLSKTVLVDYKTQDGSAQAHTDYELAEGTLVFHAGETRKHFIVNIIDDDVYEEDEHFYARITNARYQDLNGQKNVVDETTLKVAHPDVATIMILDDDHNGVFIFPEQKLEVIENVGRLRIKVLRTSGARGKVKVPYHTIDYTAVGGKDFEKKNDTLVFYNNEIEKYIEIDIFDDEDYQKNELFYVELGEPVVEKTPEEEANEAGKPKLGECFKCEVHIKESKEIKGIVDKLLVQTNASSLLVGTTSWREQFSEALKVSADDDEEEGGEEGGEASEPKSPGAFDYFMHFISLFWKILFAFVPPTDYWGGWACFVVSIFIIGVLTAVIGDLASHFGCTIGLKDSVTAISFVALGTSLPDTFASKVAAINDKYADSSVGNVTGSNAVNVFLGIGLAWTFAAFHHWLYGTQFKVDPGSLGFSVTIFCTFAFVAIAVMMIRRVPSVGGELGGPANIRIFTSSLLIGLWVLYLLLSSLETYCIIKGF
jgi:solute carrier family 8 (sodium/calcium exchanger)